MGEVTDFSWDDAYTNCEPLAATASHLAGVPQSQQRELGTQRRHDTLCFLPCSAFVCVCMCVCLCVLPRNQEGKKKKKITNSKDTEAKAVNRVHRKRIINTCET